MPHGGHNSLSSTFGHEANPHLRHDVLKLRVGLKKLSIFIVKKDEIGILIFGALVEVVAMSTLNNLEIQS